MEEVITMADAAYHATTAAAVIPSSSAPVLPYAVISVPCVCDCSIPQGYYYLLVHGLRGGAHGSGLAGALWSSIANLVIGTKFPRTPILNHVLEDASLTTPASSAPPKYKENKWDPKKIVGSGGMPSSHSSTVVALAVSIGLHDGVESSSFAMAVVMAFIVMYDASGVRLHASRQAEVLNQIVCEFPPEHPLSTSRPLRDSLGHTPLQVIAGAMLGFIVALMMKASE